MTVGELAEAILVARGSVQDEPRRTALAIAVARACSEVERTMAEPRFLVRRDHGRVLVALTQDLASYAGRLGDEADRLADEDPLVPLTRVLQRLREISLPGEATVLTDARLVRLAAAASKHAAVSSRQELYPRGMEAARAVKLSQGALYGVPFLTVLQIRDRVSSRYPESAVLPDRPALDELLQSAGFDFNWDPTGKGVGCYVSRLRDAVSVTSGSESVSRLATESGQIHAAKSRRRLQMLANLRNGWSGGSRRALFWRDGQSQMLPARSKSFANDSPLSWWTLRACLSTPCATLPRRPVRSGKPSSTLTRLPVQTRGRSSWCW